MSVPMYLIWPSVYHSVEAVKMIRFPSNGLSAGYPVAMTGCLGAQFHATPTQPVTSPTRAFTAVPLFAVTRHAWSAL